MKGGEIEMDKSYQSSDEEKSCFIVRAGKYQYFRNCRQNINTIVKDANVVSEFSDGYRVKFTLKGQTDEFSGNMYLDGSKASFNSYDDVFATDFVRDQVIAILNKKGTTITNKKLK